MIDNFKVDISLENRSDHSNIKTQMKIITVDEKIQSVNCKGYVAQVKIQLNFEDAKINLICGTPRELISLIEDLQDVKQQLEKKLQRKHLRWYD